MEDDKPKEECGVFGYAPFKLALPDCLLTAIGALSRHSLSTLMAVVEFCPAFSGGAIPPPCARAAAPANPTLLEMLLLGSQLPYSCD